MAVKMNGNDIRCSFCNKTQSQVRKLIAGPAGVYICDECIDICADILYWQFPYITITKELPHLKIWMMWSCRRVILSW